MKARPRARRASAEALGALVATLVAAVTAAVVVSVVIGLWAEGLRAATSVDPGEAPGAATTAAFGVVQALAGDRFSYAVVIRNTLGSPVPVEAYVTCPDGTVTPLTNRTLLPYETYTTTYTGLDPNCRLTIVETSLGIAYTIGP